MKAAQLLLFAFAPIVAEAADEPNVGLIAHIDTDQPLNDGIVSVVLHYDKVPKTVANFITLAEGTRARIDPNTGLLTTQPLYHGQTFYSVVNEPGVSPFPGFPPLPGTLYSITGSGTTNSTGSPGYTLPDEFDASLRHAGYALSMATLANFAGISLGSEIDRGPNTAGSQIILSGDSTLTRFDDVNTVFGSISDVDSRAVLDAIITSSGTTTITGVTIARNDQAAMDFDEHAQGLPSVGPPVGKFRVEPGAAYFDHDEALGAGSFFSMSRSSDLNSWTPELIRHIDPALAPEAATQMDEIGASKAFYELFLTRHPGSLTPSSLADRTLVLSTIGANVIIYTFVFNSEGTGGTTNYSVDNSDGAITSVSYVPQGYGAFIEISSSNIPTPLRAQLGFDAAGANEYIGRHFLEGFNDPFWGPIGNGILTLSK